MTESQKTELARINQASLQHVKKALDKFSRVGITVSAQENQAISNELTEGMLLLVEAGVTIKHIKTTEN